MLEHASKLCKGHANEQVGEARRVPECKYFNVKQLRTKKARSTRLFLSTVLTLATNLTVSVNAPGRNLSLNAGLRRSGDSKTETRAGDALT